MPNDQRYPLNWPAGQPRTPVHKRRRAPFQVTAAQAREEMLEELQRLGATGVIISSNQRRNRDGSLSARQVAIRDPGVAVYFRRKDRQLVLACDNYDELYDNIRAIGKTVEAMRGIERWGSGDMLDRAFTGFEALPAPEQWYQVLGLSSSAAADQIDAAYRDLAKTAHPDRGGSEADMSRLNAARDAGRKARA